MRLEHAAAAMHNLFALASGTVSRILVLVKMGSGDEYADGEVHIHMAYAMSKQKPWLTRQCLKSFAGIIMTGADV
jgi:hypothetical protein